MNNLLYLINARLLTMEDRDYNPGFLAAEQGKITRIGSMESLGEIPRDAQIIDARGAAVTPGLIDAHSHLGIWEDGLDFEGADGNEDTDPITPQLRAIDGVNPQDRGFREAAEAGVTTVVVGPGSANPIAGQLLAMKTVGICVDDMVLAAPLGIKAALGENPKAVYHDKNQAPVTRMGTAALIREALSRAAEYKEQLEKHQADPEEDKPEWDAKHQALLPLLRGEIPLYIHAHRLDDIFTALRLGKEFGLKLVLVHGTEAHLAAERLAGEGVPVLSGPILTDRSKPELRNQTEQAPAILTAAGIPTALITDHPETPEKYLLLCAAAAVRAGLDPRTALRSVTRIPAEICGLDARVGSLRPGKDADFVVWDGIPPEFGARPLRVFCQGREL